MHDLKTPSPIDQKQVESLARLGADDTDIATLVGVSVKSLRKRFGTVLLRARAERRAMIRKFIWSAANDANVSILTWLGKTELGWCESPRDRGAAKKKPKRSRFDFESYAKEFARLHANGKTPDEPND